MYKNNHSTKPSSQNDLNDVWKDADATPTHAVVFLAIKSSVSLVPDAGLSGTHYSIGIVSLKFLGNCLILWQDLQ